MKKLKVALFIILVVPFTALLLTAVMVKFVRAQAESDSVSATVTIGDISVALAPSSIDFGSMPLDTSRTTLESVQSTNITATVGLVLTDLDIQGANTTSASEGTDWILDSANTTLDHYILEWGDATNASTEPVSWTALTTSSALMYDDIDGATNNFKYFGLRITTPQTQTNTQGVEQSVNVTILASYGADV